MEVVIIVSLKTYKKGIFICIGLISISIILLVYNNQKQVQNQIKFSSIDKKNISSFKLHNIGLEQKEIKTKLDRNKIIDLINSVNITKSDVERRAGIGYGVIITYSNGQKFSISFLETSMGCSTDDKEGTFYEIDKNIVDDLRNYYDKN